MIRAHCSALVLLATVAATGCLTPPGAPVSGKGAAPGAPLPRELDKICLPDYRVEPPDVLLIEAVRAIPKPPYRVEPLDVLFIQVSPSLPDDPLSGLFTVEPDGTVNLGESYGGGVKVVGKTLVEVKAVLDTLFREVVKIKAPKTTVTLAQARGVQRISGPHLLRPDGSISLGTYGSVRVTGMTLAEARQAIETHLSAYLLNPEISVDVQGYNSKLYYVIQDGGGVGQTVTRLPSTGNDTVLDAVAQVSGLSAVSSQDRIWVSRPAPAGAGHQVLPVDWKAITECGDTATNYQLMPGDRVFVAAYPLVRIDNTMARVFAPVERFLGVTLLGTSTAKSIRFFNQSNGSGSSASTIP